MTDALADALSTFPSALREAGIPLAADAGARWLQALAVEPEIGTDDLFWTGRVTLVSRPEDHVVYDGVFRAFFLGEGGGRSSVPRPGEEARLEGAGEGAGTAAERRRGAENATGAKASANELVHAHHASAPRPGAEALEAVFLRHAPRERSRRWSATRGGRHVDLRATLRRAIASGGDIGEFRHRHRITRLRPVVMLVDVSRSMQGTSDAAMDAAARLARLDTRVEVFALGTRLTRATAALRRRPLPAALRQAAALVEDWDGGTRLGETLQALLADTRNAALLRGATVVLVSDALERGDPGPLAAAMERLSRLARRVVLATPLLADPRYRPRTRALAAILPSLDMLADGSDAAALAGLFGRLSEIDAAGRRSAERINGVARQERTS